MKVSVIIPTTNKELPLANRCAESVRNSTYKEIEIIIINENKKRSEQRNLGIEKSHGDFIMYLDSDHMVSPELIGECVDLMNYGYSAVYIPEIIITPGWFAYIRNWERNFYNSTPIDCVRFLKTECCPKFHTELDGPEDSQHDREVRGKRTITINPIYHYDNVGIVDFFRKKAYYCKSMQRFAERNPDDKILDWKWRCIKVFLENSKWKRFLSRPDLALAVLTLILIRGIIYLTRR